MDPEGLRGDTVFLVTQGTVAIVTTTAGGDEKPALQSNLSASSEDFTLEGDVTGACANLPGISPDLPHALLSVLLKCSLPEYLLTLTCQNSCNLNPPLSFLSTLSLVLWLRHA